MSTPVRDAELVSEPGEPTAAARPGPPQGILVMRLALAMLVFFGTLAALALHAGAPLTNTDTYFHLRFGHEFLSGAWSLRHPGSVTTFGTAHWVPTQWLPEVVMAWTEDQFGLAGVAWLQGLLHLGLALTLYVISRRYAGAMTSAVLVALALTAAAPGLSMRPQVISYLLVAVTTAAWLRTYDDGKARWWLVPLTWVWAMCHGMWPVGLVIGVVAVIGIAADRPAGGAATRRRLLTLAAIPLASAVAAALTPVGPRLYTAVLVVGGRGKYFAEWQPANFTRLAGATFVLIAGIVLVRLLRRGTANSWTMTALFGLSCGWALYTNRTLPVATMMLVPIAARALGELMTRRPALRGERALVLAGVLAALVALAVAVPHTADHGIDDPPWASALDDLPKGTAVVDDWGLGGWFMWRWPDLDFVVNGYGDIYTDGELARNAQLDAANAGWVSAVKDTGARYALLAPGSRLDYGLEQLEGWQVLHSSSDLVLLEAPDDWPDTTP